MSQDIWTGIRLINRLRHAKRLAKGTPRNSPERRILANAQAALDEHEAAIKAQWAAERRARESNPA